jgi:hypothetical protein
MTILTADSRMNCHIPPRALSSLRSPELSRNFGIAEIRKSLFRLLDLDWFARFALDRGFSRRSIKKFSVFQQFLRRESDNRT